MRTATLVFGLLLLGSEMSLADELPSVREEAEVEAMQRLPTTKADHSVSIKDIQTIRAATPNGKCTGRSGVPQVRALVLLPNERAQCAYFVA